MITRSPLLVNLGNAWGEDTGRLWACTDRMSAVWDLEGFTHIRICGSDKPIRDALLETLNLSSERWVNRRYRNYVLWLRDFARPKVWVWPEEA